MSFGEIAIIAILALIFLKPEQLPDVAKTIGKFIREIKRATTEMNHAIQKESAEIRKIHEDTKKDFKDAVDISVIKESLSISSHEKIRATPPTLTVVPPEAKEVPTDGPNHPTA